jgi:hypothetical protein
MNEAAHPGITIFAGRFGSGKTETALNYALLLGRRGECGNPRLLASQFSTESAHRAAARPRAGSSVILVDLDIVTPYFRSRETAEAMRERGVEVIAPSAIGQHLDTPAITPEILGAIQQSDRPVVLDVGGDQQGARALGQFSPAIRKQGYTMHFVVNPYRPFTANLDGLARSIAEIEDSAHLQVTDLVSNPNLIRETTIKQIVEGHTQIEAFAEALGLPVAFVCIERCWVDAIHFAQPVLPLDRHFVMSWE